MYPLILRKLNFFSKIAKEWINVKARIWISEAKMEEFFKSQNTFFILAIGRSGTLFLSQLLNQANETHIRHDPLTIDFKANQDAYHDEKKAFKYIRKFRKNEIYLNVKDKKVRLYGEVNSILRRHAMALKQEFPNCTLIHLIRDGRDYVRSAYSRIVMTNKDLNARRMFPLKGDPWEQEWKDFDKFKKLCWYWQIENKFLKNHVDLTVKFEDILSDYQYFKNNVLDVLKISVSKDIWKREVRTPKNVTLKHKLPHWKNWDEQKLQAFDKICGEVMRENNYDI